MTRSTIHFSGHVQGVGFRMTTKSIARRHCVAGYVRNLSDGRVELVMECDRAAGKVFLDEIKDTMNGYISEVEVDESPAIGEFGQPAPGALTIRH